MDQHKSFAAVIWVNGGTTIPITIMSFWSTPLSNISSFLEKLIFDEQVDK